MTLNDGTLRVSNSGTLAGALTLSGTTGGTINVTGGGALLTLAGGLFGTNQTLTVNNTGGGYGGIALTAAGGFSGSVNLVSSDAGTIAINTADGQTALANAALTIDAHSSLMLGVGDAMPLTIQINSLNGSGSVSANNIDQRTLQLGGNGGSGGFTGAISDGFGGVNGLALVKAGAGTQVLGGASTYTGGTTVTGGILRVTNSSGSATGSGLVTVGDGANPATLAGSNAPNQGAIDGPVLIQTGATLSAGSGASLTLGGGLTLSDGSLSSFAFTAAGAGNSPALVAITDGGLTVTGVNTITLRGTASAGTYDLFSFTGTVPDSGAFNLANNLGGGYNYNLVVTDSQVDLTVSNPNASAAWNFNGNGNYGTAANWNPPAFPTGAGEMATFGNGDGLSGSTTVNAPAVAVTIDNNYTVGFLVLDNTLGTSYTLAAGGAGTGLALDNSGSGAW